MEGLTKEQPGPKWEKEMSSQFADAKQVAPSAKVAQTHRSHLRTFDIDLSGEDTAEHSRRKQSKDVSEDKVPFVAQSFQG